MSVERAHFDEKKKAAGISTIESTSPPIHHLGGVVKLLL
jgi:hypothetical protein